MSIITIIFNFNVLADNSNEQYQIFEKCILLIRNNVFEFRDLLYKFPLKNMSFPITT